MLAGGYVGAWEMEKTSACSSPAVVREPCRVVDTCLAAAKKWYVAAAGMGLGDGDM